jgi:predicted RNA-binding Zn-ribbon protein involved in translation (DUF1610 family)
LIPYGVTEQGRVVLPEEALKKNTYYCPECGQELVLQSGENTVYFAHKSRGECGIHRSVQMRALLRIEMDLRRWLYQKGNPPKIQITCEQCGFRGPKKLSNEVTYFKRDYPVDQNQRADFALFNGLEMLLTAIKVVDQPDGFLVSDKVPWLEISAQKLVTDPSRWTPNSPKWRNLPIARCDCPPFEQLKLEFKFPD